MASSDSETILEVSRMSSHVAALRALTLPIEHVNPNTHEKKLQVLDRIGVLAKVKDFVPDEEVEHQWVYVGSDEGACIDFSLLNEKDKIKYGRLVMVLDTGHEDQVYLNPLPVLAPSGLSHSGQ